MKMIMSDEMSDGMSEEMIKRGIKSSRTRSMSPKP